LSIEKLPRGETRPGMDIPGMYIIQVAGGKRFSGIRMDSEDAVWIFPG
jgi:hypothetical protein